MIPADAPRGPDAWMPRAVGGITTKQIDPDDKDAFENCCSNECQEIYNLPEEKQKELRRGLNNSNQIFKKGRSEHLKYKSNKEKHISLDTNKKTKK